METITKIAFLVPSGLGIRLFLFEMALACHRRGRFVSRDFRCNVLGTRGNGTYTNTGVRMCGTNITYYILLNPILYHASTP